MLAQSSAWGGIALWVNEWSAACASRTQSGSCSVAAAGPSATGGTLPTARGRAAPTGGTAARLVVPFFFQKHPRREGSVCYQPAVGDRAFEHLALRLLLQPPPGDG